MKKLLFILFGILPSLFTLNIKAQTLEQLPNAYAYRTSFLPILVTGLTILQSGLTTSGDVWMAGFNLRYDASGNALPVECVRINATLGTYTTKIIAGTVSSISMMWLNIFDSSGNLYLGLNSGNYIVIKFNFKDSIFYDNLGGMFQIPNTLAYSAALGRDNNMYFGSSGGSFWSKYNTVTHVITTHPEVDNTENYVLSIQADATWTYLQVGQLTWIKYIAVRQSDNYKKVLDSLPSSTRYSVRTYSTGIWVSKLGVWYKVTDTTLTAQAPPAGPTIDYYENNIPGQKTVTSYFNAPSSSVVYSINGDTSDISIPASSIQTAIQFIFFDRTDTTGFYYVGNYYGTTYHYDLNTNTPSVVGISGWNIYSYYQLNDSIFYFGFYPSATVMKWNKNQQWTLQTFVNGRIADGSLITDNPHIDVQLRNTPAGFHHPNFLIPDTSGNIVSAGDVIRRANTCSVAAFNPITHAAWGYDFNKINGLSTSDLLRYKYHILFSTNNFYGGHAKLYFYNSAQNVNAMDDSLDLGYTNYGTLLLSGDTLIGTAPTFVYKVYLPTKALISTQSITSNNSFRLEHNYMGINSTDPLPDSNYFIHFKQSNAYAFNDVIYTINGNLIFKTVNNLYPIPPVVPDHPTPDQFNFIFYPNPATDKVYVIGNGKYYLLDINGALLQERPGSGVFDVSNLAAGIYFINYKKLIVQ